MECWVDLDGLNDDDKPLNKWQKYMEFNDDCKKLQSKGDYFDLVIKNRGNEEDFSIGYCPAGLNQKYSNNEKGMNELLIRRSKQK